MAFIYKSKFGLLSNSLKYVLSSRSCSTCEKKGLVLGVFSKGANNEIALTSAAEHYNKTTGGSLLEAIKLSVIH